MEKRKLRVLEGIGKNMNRHKIDWYLMGSAGLFLRRVPGISDVNDLDLLVSQDNYENIKNLFGNYLVNEGISGLGKKLLLNVDGVSVEICAEDLKGIYAESTPGELYSTVDVNGVRVPLVPLQQEESFYRMFGRNEKAELIKEFREEQRG